MKFAYSLHLKLLLVHFFCGVFFCKNSFGQLSDEFGESGYSNSFCYFTADVKNSLTGEYILTRVEVIDYSNDRTIANIKSNEKDNQFLSRVPLNKSFKLIASPDGYQSDTVIVNLNDAHLHRACKKINDTVYAFDFKLKRPKPGTVITYHHIYFWENSSVLLKKPEQDLYDLLSLLKEAPKIKVVITGHVADNEVKEIKLVGTNSEGKPDPFILGRNNPMIAGNGKKLSEERALALKLFLTQNGIAEGRIETKGMGSKKAIYQHPHLHKNNRIEIEIIE